MKKIRFLTVVAAVLALCTPPVLHAQTEGIAVRGQWTIWVYDVDGSLVTVREFHNDLTIYGGRNIARVLTGRSAFIGWQIALNAPTGTQACSSSTGDPFTCFIGPNDLTVDVASEAPYELVLSGSVVAERDGQIAFVSTNIVSDVDEWCSNGCRAVTTSTEIAPIDVLQNQTVMAEVRIAFSSATGS